MANCDKGNGKCERNDIVIYRICFRKFNFIWLINFSSITTYNYRAERVEGTRSLYFLFELNDLLVQIAVAG